MAAPVRTAPRCNAMGSERERGGRGGSGGVWRDLGGGVRSYRQTARLIHDGDLHAGR